jgi:hypothetical protein
MATMFYVKKVFQDQEPDIEMVNVHYTWTALGHPPDWGSHRETRMMPRGGVFLRGMGGTTMDDAGGAVNAVAERIEIPDDGIRRKVLRLPNVVWDSDGHSHEEYAFHYYFEIFRHGHQYHGPLHTEDIVTKEIEYTDHVGNLGGMCVYWSIGDWDTPQYSPTEEPNFIAQYGEDNPYRSHKFYGYEDKDNFSRIRGQMLRALPMPRRYVTKIRGPRGAIVQQGWHTGGLWEENPADRWEDYFGWYEHTF